MIVIEEEGLDLILANNEKTVVLVGADWCGPCKLLKPKLTALLANQSVPFVYIDAQTAPSLRKTYNITSVPTTLLFTNTTCVSQIQGSSLKEVEQFIQ